MAVSVTHATAADGTFSAGGATAWDEAHAVSGLGTMAEEAAADYSTTAVIAATYAPLSAPVFVGPVEVQDGTNAQRLSVYNTYSGSGANYERGSVQWSGSDLIIGVEVAGTGATNRQLHIRGGGSGQVRLMLNTSTAVNVGTTGTGLPGVVFYGSAATSAGSSGGVTSRTEINKAVTAFSDNVAKAVLTFTIPNAAHSASFLIRIVGSMGAGGAIGANESTQSATYIVDIARTAGVNAVATISAVFGQPAAASVSGAANIATTAALSAISGAVGAANTFTVNATLARSGGSGDNHTAMVHCSLLNANASGVTVA